MDERVQLAAFSSPLSSLLTVWPGAELGRSWVRAAGASRRCGLPLQRWSLGLQWAHFFVVGRAELQRLRGAGAGCSVGRAQDWIAGSASVVWEAVLRGWLPRYVEGGQDLSSQEVVLVGEFEVNLYFIVT